MNWKKIIKIVEIKINLLYSIIVRRCTMNKLKINTGLASVVLLCSLVSGWSTLLTIVVLMLIFCEISDSVKQVMVRVITFYFGITLFSTFWGLIVDGVDLGINSFNDVIEIFNSYLNDPISVFKLEMYLLNPISKVVSLLDGIVSYLLVFIKFSFIISVLTNKNMKDNFIMKKITEFVDKVISYVNSFDVMQSNNNQQLNLNKIISGEQNIQDNSSSTNNIFPNGLQ